jgi:tetratricopeptide (TPR) repeat protein
VADDAERPDHLELLHTLADAAGPELTALFPVEAGMYVGLAACRAFALQRAGRNDEALRLLCECTAALPSVRALSWARDWPVPAQPRAAISALLQTSDPSAWALAWDVLGERAVDAHGEDDELLALLSIGSRRAGALDRAVSLAERATERDESWMAWIALANARLEKGDWKGAQAAWRGAVCLRPDDASALLDWGDNHVHRKEYERAAMRYEEALAVDPGNDWAEASVRWLRYRDEASASARTELVRWCRANDGPRARQVVSWVLPWVGWLPDPPEATWSGVSKAVADGVELGSMRVSHLEGASCLLAVSRLCPGVTLEYQEVPSPDPRIPLDFAHTELIRWDGTRPRAMLGPPSSDTWLAVLKLAPFRFDAADWLEVAGRALQPADQLLAAALHPPPPPEGATAVDWLWRVQHAVAFLLAATPGWSEEMPHVQALDSMLAERNDWLAVAAMAGLRQRALNDAAARRHLLGRVLEHLRSPPTSGGWSVHSAAWEAVLDLDPENALGLHERAFEELDG